MAIGTTTSDSLQACGDCNIHNIQANLHYLDYMKLKARDEEPQQ